MASRKKNPEPSESMSKNARRHCGEAMFSSSSDDDTEVTVGCRSCRNTSSEHFGRTRITTEPPTVSQDTTRREENPFSFKQFLKNGSQSNYQNTGARPKVYSLPVSNPNNMEKDTGVYSRKPTELPDFVQDHMVIKQCYLPPSAYNRTEQRQTRPSNESKKSASGFPLDLPLPLDETDPNSNISTRDGPVAGKASVPKSLPDFLSDGLIHNRTALSTDPGSTPNVAEPTEQRLLLENERLYHELEVARKQINEKSKRINLLTSEWKSRREVEHEETAHLEKAMEQVEDNLKRSTRRAVSAESTVTLLKKEIKSLTAEISRLQVENKKLRMDMAGGGDFGSSPYAERTIRRLANDLRGAASAAEISLRQLMSGVDNLRVLASTIENVDRVEDRTKDFVSDFDEDNAAGPAL